MNINIAITMSALVGTLALSSCAAQAVDHKAAAKPSTPAPVTVTAPAVTTAAPKPVANTTGDGSGQHGAWTTAEGLRAAREQSPALNGVSDATIIKAGKTNCTALESGIPFATLARRDLAAGSGSQWAKVSGTVLAFGVLTYCTEYQHDMMYYANH